MADEILGPFGPLDYVPENSVPLPPVNANEVTTACDYCIVACGYRVYTWPVDAESGGPKADENAMGLSFPAPALGGWLNPNQHTIAKVQGEPHHILVVPDFKADVVNRGGNHSIRGGSLAGKIFREDGPTSDRLKSPMIRINGELTEVDWDTALEVMVGISEYVLEKYGKPAWGMKTYSYAFWENTYAISKLAFGAIKTPAYAPHDKPGPGSDIAGFDDSGLDPFSASYQDWGTAEVIFVSGTDPFETKTIVFTEWIMKSRPKLVMVLPRRTTGVAWAEQNGGLFLQIIPGTDTVLHLAMIRLILENGWEDSEWIEKHIASQWDVNAGMGRGTRDTPWQWRTTWGQFGAGYAEYREWILNYEFAELDRAAEITGIPADKIMQAAEMIAAPVDGERPVTSFALEKGNYWSNNYGNTASLAAMGLICGAGSRPGRVISRMGGHQRGWRGAASYPRSDSPERLPGRRRKPIDLDRWVEQGELKFAWVIGTTWTRAMAASKDLADSFRSMTVDSPHQITSSDPQEIIQTLKDRVDDGGMAIVHQDIYLIEPMGSEMADIVLPAAGWGEENFVRANGERRIRLYSKFYDPPGDAKPDWWIISQFAQRMGFQGFDWKDTNEIFEEASRTSRGHRTDYHALVWEAKRQGKRGHDMLGEYGTTGIQGPIRWENGELVGTVRLHDETLELPPPQGPTVHTKRLTNFHTHSGKAVLNKSPWELFSDFFERITPGEGEFWLTTGRINERWQSAYDDIRKPYLAQRFPDNFIEIHPDDAARYGIENGDFVRMWSDDVLIQTGGYVQTESNSYSYTELEEAGLIRIGSGEAQAVAIVTDDILPGVLFSDFLWPGSETNSMVHRVPDPITNRYRFKLGKCRIENAGESPYKNNFGAFSFKSRTIM
jgi:arsenite oxidase large subunit